MKQKKPIPVQVRRRVRGRRLYDKKGKREKSGPGLFVDYQA